MLNTLIDSFQTTKNNPVEKLPDEKRKAKHTHAHAHTHTHTNLFRIRQIALCVHLCSLECPVKCDKRKAFFFLLKEKHFFFLQRDVNSMQEAIMRTLLVTPPLVHEKKQKEKR